MERSTSYLTYVHNTAGLPAWRMSEECKGPGYSYTFIEQRKGPTWGSAVENVASPAGLRPGA